MPIFLDRYGNQIHVWCEHDVPYFDPASAAGVLAVAGIGPSESLDEVQGTAVDLTGYGDGQNPHPEAHAGASSSSTPRTAAAVSAPMASAEAPLVDGRGSAPAPPGTEGDVVDGDRVVGASDGEVASGTEERWGSGLRPHTHLEHLLTHLPKLPGCPACQAAKMKRSPCKTKEGVSE